MMISKLDDFLKEEYKKINKILDNNNYEITSEILLYILIKKEDSLLNCLVQLNLDDVICFCDEYKKGITLNKLIKESNEIIKLSYDLARKDHLELINDEHLLYAILLLDDTFPYTILKELNCDMNRIKQSVEDYFEYEEDDYLVNLTALAKLNKFNPLIGRKSYIDRIIRILSKKQKNNLILIGSAGVGKSALVEGVVMELVNLGIDQIVYRLDIGSIMAGTRYRGDLEERIIEMIRKVKDKNAILFIDEIHNIMGGNKSEDVINIANILKPVLARSEVKCIGATTLEEYYDHIDKDKALARRFQNIFIPEATSNETEEILNKIKSKYEDFYSLKYSKEIIKEIVSNCHFFPNRKYPDKAIDIMDELGSYTKRKGYKRIYKKDIKEVILDNIGINSKHKIRKVNYPQILEYYKQFKNGKNNRETIMNICTSHCNINSICNDIKEIFQIPEEAILNIDLEIFDDYTYDYLIKDVLKYPILLIIIKNYEKANFQIKKRIEKMIEFGYVCDNKGRVISFRNTIFVFLNMINKKEVIGFQDENSNINFSSLLIDISINDKQVVEILK